MNCGKCDPVDDLMLSQEAAPQTNQSVLLSSRNTRICRSSVGRIVYDLFRATHPDENNVPIRLLMYFRVM